MYCSVAFSFQSSWKPIKKRLVYKTNGISLKHGDVVEVLKRGKSTLGVVNSVFEEDEFNLRGLERINIERKLHTNTVKALVRKRFNEFKDIDITKKGKRLKRKTVRLLGEDYRIEVLKWICLGNAYHYNDNLIKFVYKNRFVFVGIADDGAYYIQEVCVCKIDEHEAYKWTVNQKARNYFNELILQP